MTTQIKATESLEEILTKLKNILSWIGVQKDEWSKFYSPREIPNELEIKILTIAELVNLIKEQQQNSFQEILNVNQRPDDLYAFVCYLKNENGCSLKNSGLCIITSHFYQELMKDTMLTDESLKKKLESAYDGKFKTISLSYDNGLPYIGKGVNIDKIKFLVEYESYQ